MAKNISLDEKRWQAEEDARTMARYQEIMSDPKRKAAAVKQAKTEANNLQKRANTMLAASKVRK